MKQVFNNGWYRVLTRDDSYTLYRADGSLVADKLQGCYVFDNGWYYVETEDGCALHRADETLVEDELLFCFVSDDGSYKLINKDGEELFFTANGTRIYNDESTNW